MASMEGCGSCHTWEALGDICGANFSRIKGFGIMKMYDDSYTRNFIDTTSETLGADVLAMSNMTDPDGKFLFMSPIADLVTPARSDENFVTNDDGENVSLRTGQKVSFIFEFWGAPPALAEKYKKMTCTDFQIFLVDDAGNFIGSEYADGDHTKLYGWAVNKESFVANYMIRTAAASSMVRVVFDLISVLEKSSTYSILTPDQLGYSAIATLLPAKHVEDVAEVVDTTTITVVLRSKAISSNQYTYARGLTVTNGAVWKFVNDTDGTTQTLLAGAVVFNDVDPEAVAPGNEPSYTLTITPGTAGDKAHVEVVKAGYLIQNSNQLTLV